MSQTGHSIKKFARNMFVYGAGDILAKVLSIITVPIFTRIFIPADYGVIGLVGNISAFLSPILFIGLLPAFQTFYFGASEEERRNITKTIFTTLLIWSGLVVFILFQI